MAGIESLAGVFHPHAIEVQDFSCYALVIDVRDRPAFDDDHIPGALHVLPEGMAAGSPVATTGDGGASNVLIASEEAAPAAVPPALRERLTGLGFDQAILVYGGRGGADSLALARTLRWLGWTVDVLPGGWTNYRRWVQAGLEMLPRLVPFRVLSVALDCEAARVLQALSAAGQQVLDIAAMAGRPGGEPADLATGPVPQAWFESQLLQALRDLDPCRHVWARDIGRGHGGVVVPGALMDALDRAPAATVAAPLRARAALWLDTDPRWRTAPWTVVDAMASDPSPPGQETLNRWRAQAGARIDDLVASVLRDHIDAVWQAQAAARLARANALPALSVDTFEPDRLPTAVRSWLQAQGVSSVR